MDGVVAVNVVVIEGAEGCEGVLVVGVGFVSVDVAVVVVVAVEGCEAALLTC